MYLFGGAFRCLEFLRGRIFPTGNDEAVAGQPNIFASVVASPGETTAKRGGYDPVGQELDLFEDEAENFSDDDDDDDDAAAFADWAPPRGAPATSPTSTSTAVPAREVKSSSSMFAASSRSISHSVAHPEDGKKGDNSEGLPRVSPLPASPLPRSEAKKMRAPAESNTAPPTLPPRANPQEIPPGRGEDVFESMAPRPVASGTRTRRSS